MNSAPCGDPGLPSSSTVGPHLKIATLSKLGRIQPATRERLFPSSSSCILPARRTSRIDKPPEARLGADSRSSPPTQVRNLVCRILQRQRRARIVHQIIALFYVPRHLGRWHDVTVRPDRPRRIVRHLADIFVRVEVAEHTMRLVRRRVSVDRQQLADHRLQEDSIS